MSWCELSSQMDAPDQGTKEDLKRWLSVKLTVSPEFLNAIKEADATTDVRGFRSIGKGFCAEIFAEVGTGKVVKRAFQPQNFQLANDLRKHTKIRAKVYQILEEQPNIRLSVPKVYEYYTRDDITWWDTKRNKWPTQALREPTDLLQMEHILPLPKIVRNALIDMYCPAEKRASARADEKNRDCLVRVYLGVRKASAAVPSKDGFSLRNSEADLSIVDELMPEKNHHAIAMATALASMHWQARVDAADVEFVLGTSPEDQELTYSEIALFPLRTSTAHIKNSLRRGVHLWLLDFNQVGDITMDDAGVAKAVAAFWQNDPYFPRPQSIHHLDGPLWEIFREAYLDQSGRIRNPDERRLGLANKFIKGVEQEAERRRAGPPSGGPPRGGGLARGGGPPREGGPPPGGRGASRGGRGVRRRGGRGRGGMTDIPELDT